MELDHLRNFITIVETGSFSAASKILMIAQPALSYQIKTMEKYYGAPLLVRGSRRVSLTEMGDIIYEQAKHIVAIDNGMRLSVENHVSGRSGILWYGMAPTYPDVLIDRIMCDFHNAYPDIHFQSFERHSLEIFKLLINNVVETAIFRVFADMYGTVSQEIEGRFAADERIVLFFRNDTPWIKPRGGSVPVSALEGVPLSVSVTYRKRITQLCMKAGFMPDFISVSTTRPAIRSWAMNGSAVAILASTRLVEEPGYTYCYLDGDGLEVKHVFAVAKGKKLMPVTETFLDFAYKYVEAENKGVSCK